MNFNMLENAMDSLSESIDYYRSGIDYSNERCFKFCILLLSHCAELLLKEILYRQHEVLIYENIDNFKGKDDKTVGYKSALNRVKKICKIDLGRYETYLDELVKHRNKIQHYEIAISSELCTKIITESFSAIEYIVIHIFEKTFDDFGEVITKDQIDYLHEDRYVYNKRKQDISRDIAEHNLEKIGVEYKATKYLYTPCPICTEETLVVEGEHIICKFCGKRYATIEDLYNDDRNCVIADHMCSEVGRRKTILQGGIYECTECNNNTLIYIESLDKWKCLACGLEVSSTSCTDCGNVIPNSDHYYIFAQSYTNTEDYMYLCTECGKNLEESEYSCEYDIS